MTKRTRNPVHLKCASAVRRALDHRGEYGSEWEAIIASKIGYTGESLRDRMRRAERDADMRPGLTRAELTRIKELEREVHDLRQADEILRKVSPCFAMAELDCPLKR